MARLLYLIALSWVLGCASVSAGVAGTVTFVVGDSTVLHDGGRAEPLGRGNPVHEGQSIATGANGHVHLRMIDDAFLSVRPNSLLRIESYRYDPAQPSANNIKYVLEKGVVRSISGKAGEQSKDSYRLNTPLAAIGIRGTDFVVQTDGSVTRVIVQSGAVVVAPLGDDCKAADTGPCQGERSRVLSATMKDAYLELRNRGEAPVLVPSDRGLNSPNLIAPPLSSEPGVARPGGTVGGIGGSVVDTSASSILDQVGNVVAPPPAPLPPRQVFWGRWSPLAATSAGGVTELAAGLVDAPGFSYETVDNTIGTVEFGIHRLIDPSYVVTFPAGSARFNLSASEAYLRTDGVTALTPLAVSQPSLSINFDARSFATSLSLREPGGTLHPLSSSGVVTSSGYLVGGNQPGEAQVRGALSFDTTQAGYAFIKSLGGGLNAVGATFWRR